MGVSEGIFAVSGASYPAHVRAVLEHEIAPVVMALEDIACSVGGEYGARLAMVSEHLRSVVSHLPDIVASETPTSGGVASSEPLSEALAAAACVSVSRLEVSQLPEQSSLLVPYPHLRVALRNLVSNAERHSGGVGSVVLSVEGSILTVQVANRVEGFRLDGQDGQDGQDGMGVGVAIVDILMRSCGGRFSGCSPYGTSGYTARLEVPCWPAGG